MKHFALTLTTVFTAAVLAHPAAGAVKTETIELDREMVRENRNFGYSKSEIDKYFAQPRILEYDYTGMDMSRITKAPPPGVHPRIYLNPEELPAWRKRIKSHPASSKLFASLKKKIDSFLTGNKVKNRALYDAAARGEVKKEMAEGEFPYYVEHEVLRALIEEDEKGGKKAVAALVSVAKADYEKILEIEKKLKDRKRPTNDYQDFSAATQWGNLGLAYDFGYNFMTDAQRREIRKVLVKATSGMRFIGIDTLPSFNANVSNWIGMHMRFIFLLCAIEGEEGYDHTRYQKLVDCYKKFFTIATFPDGEMYEGFGKGWLGAEHAFVMARRGGENLLALKNVRAVFEKYALHAMIPFRTPWKLFGGNYTFYDSQGGTGNYFMFYDPLVMKYLYPDDPLYNLHYRVFTGEDYQRLLDQSNPIRFRHLVDVHNTVAYLFFASPIDKSRSFEEEKKAVLEKNGLDFYGEYTGNLISLSDATANAMQFHLNTRSVTGGHVYADRGHFSLYADGKFWSVYLVMRQIKEHYLAKNRSVPLIDGIGASTFPGKAAAHSLQPQAAFAAVDLKPAFDYKWSNREKKGVKEFTLNDFRPSPSNLPWMNMPITDLPNWQTSQKGQYYYDKNYPVRKAFRTGGLVRGKHPYALIVDDLEKDGMPHLYRWNMATEKSVQLEKTAIEQNNNGSFRRDAILGDGKPGKLLIRVLDADGFTDAKCFVRDKDLLPNGGKNTYEVNKFGIDVKSRKPDFKILMFPFRNEAELPQSTWNSTKDRLTLKWHDQTDIIDFSERADGRTGIKISRDGKTIMDI